MIKERMGLSTGGFPDYDMSFIKDMPESDFCELSSRMTDAAQQALREVGIAVLTYDRVHGIDRDPSVDYNALKRKSAEREDKTYGTRIHQSRGLRDTEPYTEQGTTGAADEIRTYAQDLAEKELQGEVRYDANVRGTSGTLPGGTEESTGRDGQNRAADEKTGRSDRAAEDAGPAEMDTNDEQHPEQGGGNSEGYSDLHFIENEIVPESGTSEDEYVPESGTGLYFMPELPTDIEQQEGRILRQGNRNERVKIFRYVTENTFDSYSWQLIENKQKFIGQIMTSKSPVRSCDDVDEAALSYAEVKALATGNPYIKEKMTLDTEVAKLKLLKANFKSQKYRLEDAINKEYPVRIAKLEEKIEGLRQDIITRGANQMKSDEEFAITVNGMTYTDKKDGGAALIAAVKDAKSIDREKVGRYCGFDLYGRFDVFENGFRVFLQGKMEHILEISSDPHGMITRLNNCMASFDRTLTEAEEALADTCAKLETAKTEVTKEFDKEDILSEKLKRLSFLNAQLDADRKETPQNAPQNKQAQRNDIKEKYIKI